MTGCFAEGLAAVTINYNLGYVDKSGTEVIEAKFDQAGPFEDGIARVHYKGKHGYIDSSGKFIWLEK